MDFSYILELSLILISCILLLCLLTCLSIQIIGVTGTLAESKYNQKTILFFLPLPVKSHSFLLPLDKICDRSHDFSGPSLVIKNLLILKVLNSCLCLAPNLSHLRLAQVPEQAPVVSPAGPGVTSLISASQGQWRVLGEGSLVSLCVCACALETVGWKLYLLVYDYLYILMIGSALLV